MRSINDNSAEQGSRCANLPAQVWIRRILRPLILIFSASFSSEFSLSPGGGLSSTDSSLSFPTKDRGWRADRFLACWQWKYSCFPVGSPETVCFCLHVGLEVSLYDYKDQLTAEKQLLWWFYLSVPKWHFIQNINYLAHCFPNTSSSFFIEQL